MPINSTHPAYDANIDKWQRCRDAYDGEDAVKEAGTKYLPKLGSQDSNEYDAYKLRGLYYEAVGRTVDGFVGAIARKPPEIKVPDAFESVVADVTADGVDSLEFIKLLSSETLLTGRTGLLVDFDDAKQRAYLTVYRAESIINWWSDQIVLSEMICVPDPKDQYKQIEVEQLRALSLTDGKYTVTLWRRKQSAVGESDFVAEEPTSPTKRGEPLKEIPFFWLTPRGGTAGIEKPPLLGLVNVALSHYRSSADLEHGRHFTGLPVLWVSGVEDDERPILIGSATVFKVPNPQGKVEYAEFRGTGLGSLEKALSDKEHMMAVLGAAVFADQRKGVEAAETARIRSSGETSLLMGVVSAVESVFEAALKCAAAWMGITGEIDVDINRDFVDATIPPQQLQGLTQAFQAGAISLDTYLYNIKAAEMMAPNWSIEDEKAALDASRSKPKLMNLDNTDDGPTA